MISERKTVAAFAIVTLALLPISAPIFAAALLYGWLRDRWRRRRPWWVER